MEDGITLKALAIRFNCARRENITLKFIQFPRHYSLILWLNRTFRAGWFVWARLQARCRTSEVPYLIVHSEPVGSSRSDSRRQARCRTSEITAAAGRQISIPTTADESRRKTETNVRMLWLPPWQTEWSPVNRRLGAQRSGHRLRQGYPTLAAIYPWKYTYHPHSNRNWFPANLLRN